VEVESDAFQDDIGNQVRRCLKGITLGRPKWLARLETVCPPVFLLRNSGNQA
jgi:hypothetical protein